MQKLAAPRAVIQFSYKKMFDSHSWERWNNFSN